MKYYEIQFNRSDNWEDGFVYYLNTPKTLYTLECLTNALMDKMYNNNNDDEATELRIAIGDELGNIMQFMEISEETYSLNCGI